ncbi:LysM domain-containing protein [Piscinibacter sakaiensis]|uniref:LysM peptidoglycan-binding domain-containing protein n=1 Tax=Piscinibacter sakaiensis TaxID=1547922 RepID=UPI00372AAB40
MAQKLAMAAVEMLEAGNEDQARQEISAALAADPANRLAQSLQRQITVDPQAALGRESFAYTVRPTDTLSRIAGRFLNDIFSFYLLARYNDIKVPRQVAAGQVIRIPGKAPPPGADRERLRLPSLRRASARCGPASRPNAAATWTVRCRSTPAPPAWTRPARRRR